MPESADLAAMFLAHVKRRFAPPVDTTELQRVLTQVWESARARWQGVNLSPELFMRHLAERLPEVGPGSTVESVLGQMSLDELYLACACLHQVPLSAEAFEQHYLRKLPGLLRHRERSAAAIDEICQLTGVKLLVASAEGGPPKIAGYTGKGALMNWVRVIAAHVASREREKGGREDSQDEEVIGRQLGVEDPRSRFLKDHHREDLRQAMREAFASLSEDERYHLRLYYVDGLSGYEMAPLLGTSQPTVARRLASIREKIHTQTRRHLQEKLGLNQQEFQSFMKLVDSQFDLSLSKLLGELPAPPG
jgi:RNA polymerase sigma-70 factor